MFKKILTALAFTATILTVSVSAAGIPNLYIDGNLTVNTHVLETTRDIVGTQTLSATGNLALFSPKYKIKVKSAYILPGSAISANDSNYWTFTITNKGADGTGTTELLSNTAGINTTKSTGGFSLTAYKLQALTLTAANTTVTAGQVLLFTATKTGSASNLTDYSLVVDYEIKE
jgi:hypothetical protein